MPVGNLVENTGYPSFKEKKELVQPLYSSFHPFFSKPEIKQKISLAGDGIIHNNIYNTNGDNPIPNNQ